MYRNFICYRGGSSAGILVANEIYAYNTCRDVGQTYYSPEKENIREIRNFLLDPAKVLGHAENFIMLLTKDFFADFYIDKEINENSVTMIEISEALKNPAIKFIPVIFSDFAWESKTAGKINKNIIADIWGYDAMNRIVGSPPIPYIFQYKNQVYNLIFDELKTLTRQKKLLFLILMERLQNHELTTIHGSYFGII